MVVKYILAAIVGYLFGSLNPAALISKIKHKNIRKSGTCNLGATNVMLNFGKGMGALVMLFDISKAVIAYNVAALVFPTLKLIGLVAGISAVLGHIFPFYLGFKGGKGLASFGGLVLAHSPIIFLFLLVTGCVLMVIVNYSFILPFYAGIAFPILVGLHERDLFSFLLTGGISALIICKHYGNFIKAKNGTDNKIRDQIKKMFGKETEKKNKV